MSARDQIPLPDYNPAHASTDLASVELNARTSAVLQSWKEIASELNCGVRTAQRWERKLGLPVRRIGKGPKGRVVGFKHELDRWLRVNAKSCTEHRQDLLKSFTNFFRAARQSADVEQSCDQCGSSMKFLKGQVWIYGTSAKLPLMLPVCPSCDADSLEQFRCSRTLQ